ncbi:MAG: hypothetical protein U0794_10285 [Isosphaeraceae bacterium]
MSTLPTSPRIDPTTGPVLRIENGSDDPVLPPLESERVAARLEAWRKLLRPDGEVQEWVVTQVLLAAVRLEHCQEHVARLRQYEATRASLVWENDRRLEAEELAARLPRDPARVRRKLERTLQGAEWLIARWNDLGCRLVSGRTWTDSECNEALNLLGQPAAWVTCKGRKDSEGSVDGELDTGRRLIPREPAAQMELARSEAERLTALKKRALETLDARERELACQGLPVGLGTTLRQLLSYEARLRREYQAALNDMKRIQIQASSTRWVRLGPEHRPTPPTTERSSAGSSTTTPPSRSSRSDSSQPTRPRPVADSPGSSFKPDSSLLPDNVLSRLSRRAGKRGKEPRDSRPGPA